MTESFRLGGQAIRQIVLDPLLPEPIVPAAERAALVAALRRYDRMGRSCWAEFMRATLRCAVMSVAYFTTLKGLPLMSKIGL